MLCALMKIDQVILKKCLSLLVCVSFVSTLVVPPAYSQALMGKDLPQLPKPGSMVALSNSVNPPVLRGIKVYTNNPLKFDFILDPGDKDRKAIVNGRIDPKIQAELRETSNRLFKYFLTTLTVPDNDIWVNLSPYEKNRITSKTFSQTEMGRDLLGQDYLLKQITASLMFPEGEAGKKFWARVYEEAQKKFGSTQIPVNTFNKVWIMPDKAVIYEKMGNNQATAFVIESRLKVMLESDYIAKKGAETAAAFGAVRKGPITDTQKLSENIVREIIIPILEKEVNQGENFAPLRQVYNSILLALWYKERMQGSILSSAYVNRSKVVGVNVKDKSVTQKIWQLYVNAYKKGAFNIINEEKDIATHEIIPRKYFAGGFSLEGSNKAMTVVGALNEKLRNTLATFMVAGLIAITAGCGTEPQVEQAPPIGNKPTPTPIASPTPVFTPISSFPLVPVLNGSLNSVSIGVINGLLTVASSTITGTQTWSFDLTTLVISNFASGSIIGPTTSYAPGDPLYQAQLNQLLDLLKITSNTGQQGVVDTAVNTINALEAHPPGIQPPANNGALSINVNNGAGLSYNVTTDLYGDVTVIAANAGGSTSYTYYSGSTGGPAFVLVLSGAGGGGVAINTPEGQADISTMVQILQAVSSLSPDNAPQLAVVIAALEAVTSSVFTPTSSFSLVPVLNGSLNSVSIGVINGLLTVASSTITGTQTWSFDLTTLVISNFASGSIIGPTTSYAPGDPLYQAQLNQLLDLINVKSNTGQQGVVDTAVNTINALEAHPPGTPAPANNGTLDINVTDDKTGLSYNVTTDLYGDVTVIAANAGGSTSYTYYSGSTGGPAFVLVLSGAGGGGVAINTPEGQADISTMIQILQAVSSLSPDNAPQLAAVIDALQKAGNNPQARTAKNFIHQIEGTPLVIGRAAGVPYIYDGGKNVVYMPPRQADAAMSGNKSNERFIRGGIDLNKNSIPLDVRNKGGAINFNIDPAQIERIKVAPGLTPEVFTINPLQNLPEFLGMTKEEAQQMMAV